jgi:hypothetical protein
VAYGGDPGGYRYLCTARGACAGVRRVAAARRPVEAAEAAVRTQAAMMEPVALAAAGVQYAGVSALGLARGDVSVRAGGRGSFHS